MFLEESTYPWILKLGSQELQVVQTSLKVAAESGELDSMSEDEAHRLSENIDRIVAEKLEKRRRYREQKERERGGHKRSHKQERDFSYSKESDD